MTRALYPGTFDPIHNGHVDIAARAAGLFDELIIGVYDSPPKTLTFDTPQRLSLARDALAHLPNVRVMPYHGLTVAFARPTSAAEVEASWRAAPGVEVVEPLVLNEVVETDAVLVSRPRFSDAGTLLAATAMFDGLRLGGALTALEVLWAIAVAPSIPG